MQADAIRSEVILTLRRHFKVDLDVILFAHADLRLGSDPVIPDTLPTTKSPRVRVKIEALLKQGIQRAAVASANPDADKHIRVTEVRRGDSTAIEPRGLTPVSIKTNVLDRVMSRVKSSVKRDDAIRLVWRALTRYKALGLWNTMSAAVPPDIYLRLSPYGAVEAFASLFNVALPTYYGLFPDIEQAFGCIGNFFSMSSESAPSMLVCNPPYMPFIMNAFAVKAIELLDGTQTTLLAILPAFETADRAKLNASGRCANQYPVDYVTDTDTKLLKDSRYKRWCGLYCKESFRFVESTQGVEMAMTSAMVIVLSSQARMDPTVAQIRQLLPPADTECSEGNRAVAIYIDLLKSGA